MAELSDSKVLREYAALGYVVADSYKKRGDGVLLEHAYAQFPNSADRFLILLPSLDQMEHFSRFVRTVLALAASSTAPEFRLHVEAGLLLIIPPDVWIENSSNFSALHPNTKFVLPVVEVWAKLFRGGVHRQSDTAKLSITKSEHEKLARQYERSSHEAELFVGNRVKDPPFSCDFFDGLCERIVELNRRYDRMVASAYDAQIAAKNQSSKAIEWRDLQQHRRAAGPSAASNPTGRRAAASMFMPPIYAANTAGSVFSSACRHFNLDCLGTMLDHMPTTPGINRPSYLYVSMKGTCAPWHVEDGRLFSVFYLHAGSAAKFWYSVSASHSRQFEAVLDELCPFFKDCCKRFLDHKEVLVAPELLRERGLSINVLVQLPSTYVLTMADVYHCVLNSGYGIGTAINFALESWFSHGEDVRLRHLYCMDDICAKLEGFHADGTSKDDFYQVVATGFDGTSFTVRMSRRRLVVHVKRRWFREYMRFMSLHGTGVGFYLDGYQPSGLWWLEEDATASHPSGAEAMDVESAAPSMSSSAAPSAASSDVVSAFAVIGRLFAEGSWKLASTESDDAMLLLVHARKAAAGAVDVDALISALRSASCAGGSLALEPLPVRPSIVLSANVPSSSRDSPARFVVPSRGASAIPSRSQSPAPVMDVSDGPEDRDLPSGPVDSLAEPAAASTSSVTASTATASRSVVSTRGKRGGRISSAPSRAAVSCEHCGKVFLGEWLLKRHLSSCRPSDPVQCPRCGVLLKNEAVLVAHNTKTLCGKAARTSSAASSASGSSSPRAGTSSSSH